jgi:TP901 family phage tail tape measure protein
MAKSIRDIVVRIDAETKRLEGGVYRSSEALRGMQRELKRLEAQQAKQHKAMTEVGQAGMVMGAALAAGIGLSVKAAVDWESVWAGVAKTVDGNAKQMAVLEGELRDLAKTLPITHTELAGIAEAAGQLGVQRDKIVEFTRVVVALGQTTDLSFDDAATSLAQFANVMKISQDDFGRVGATLVDLGNNGASTESQIMALAQRLAGAGALIGATPSAVLALASSMADLGIEAELGGGAMSRTITKIYSAVMQGGDSLDAFAQTAGMTGQALAAAFGREPVQAIDAIVRGLARTKDEGGNVVEALSDMGIKGTQDLQVLLRLTGAGDGLTQSLSRSADAWEANTALVKEAEQRYATTASKMQTARNTLNDLAIGIGETLLPAVAGATDKVAALLDLIGGAPGWLRTTIAVVGTLGATIGVIGGAALIAVPKLIAFRTALATLATTAPRTAGALGMVGTAMGKLGVAGAVVGAVAGVAMALDQVSTATAKSAPGVNAVTESLADFSRTGQAAGALAQIVGDDFTGLADKIAVANQNKWSPFDGEGFREVVTAREEIKAFDQALTGLVSKGNLELAGQALAAAGLSAEDAADALPEYTEALAGHSAESKFAADGAGKVAEGLAGVGDAAAGAAPKVDELSDAQKALETALGSFVDPLGTYTEMVQEMAEQTAASTKDSKDSWQDYAGTAVVALDQLAARLEEDNRAASEWRKNLVTNAQKYGVEVAQILAEMGEKGHRLTAQMAEDVTGDGQRMANGLVEQAHLAGKGAAIALDQEMQVMAAIAAAGGKATVEQIAAQLQYGTGIVLDIASRWGVSLTQGLDPILLALGRPGILAGTSGRARHYADGGFEDHVAQIAQPGVVPRVWAERETGGEAYIPPVPVRRRKTPVPA